MKKNFNNRTHVEGYLYDHSLELKVSGPNSARPGTEYIAGTVEIATDEAKTNIVPVHFTYVTSTTSKGTKNATYATLLDIVTGKLKSIMNNPEDKPVAMLRIDSAIGLNEFFDSRNNDALISARRNEGGFVHVTNILNVDEKERNTFDCDMIITGMAMKEADPERNLPEKAILKGWIFDFRNSLLPLELSVLNPNAIAYFEGLEISTKNPTFTHLRGRQVSEVVAKTITEESSFGEPYVREVKNTRKDFVVTWAANMPYEWDDPSTVTVNELKELMAARETYLATLKQRNDEYKNSRNAAAAAPVTPEAIVNTGFNF